MCIMLYKLVLDEMLACYKYSMRLLFCKIYRDESHLAHKLLLIVLHKSHKH